MRTRQPKSPPIVENEDVPPLPLDGRLGASINETCAALGIERGSVYALINTGELTVSEFGRRTIVHVASIRELMRRTVIKPKPRVRRVRHTAISATT